MAAQQGEPISATRLFFHQRDEVREDLVLHRHAHAETHSLSLPHSENKTQLSLLHKKAENSLSVIFSSISATKCDEIWFCIATRMPKLSLSLPHSENKTQLSLPQKSGKLSLCHLFFHQRDEVREELVLHRHAQNTSLSLSLPHKKGNSLSLSSYRPHAFSSISATKCEKIWFCIATRMPSSRLSSFLTPGQVESTPTPAMASSASSRYCDHFPLSESFARSPSALRTCAEGGMVAAKSGLPT